LYFEFISFAVSAIAVTVLSKSTRLFAGISLVAIRCPVHALTAPNAQRSMASDVTRDRIAGHPKMVLQRALGAVRRDLRGATIRLGDCRTHCRGDSDSAWQPPSAARRALCLHR
jgi:hypothetical protein